MFAFHETTRRLLSRSGFTLLCLLPTLVVGAWCLFTLTPTYAAWQRQVWQSQAGELLGLTAALDRVSYPRPHVTLLQGVTLIDPETDATLAEIRTLEATRNDRGWVLLATFAELRAAHLAKLHELLHARGLRTMTADSAPVELIASEVTIRHESTAETLKDFHLALQPHEFGVRATLEFRVAGLSMAQPAQLTISRNRQVTPPTTQWELNTKGTQLPCSMLAAVWPAAESLGPESHFDGVATFTDTGSSWNGSLAGRLTGVDLNQLVTNQFPHRLGGVAEMVFNKVTVADGNLIEAAGAVHSREGVISRSLLASVSRAETTDMQLSPRVAENQELLWRYQELSFGFRMDGTELTIKGLCTRTEPGVLLTDHAGALLRESSQIGVPAMALIRALVPASEIQVPASRQTRRLIDLFPIPDLKIPLTEKQPASRPYAPLRFHERR